MQAFGIRAGRQRQCYIRREHHFSKVKGVIQRRQTRARILACVQWLLISRRKKEGNREKGNCGPREGQDWDLGRFTGCRQDSGVGDCASALRTSCSQWKQSWGVTSFSIQSISECDCIHLIITFSPDFVITASVNVKLCVSWQNELNPS